MLLQNDSKASLCLRKDVAFTIPTCVSALPTSLPLCLLLLGLRINKTFTSSLISDNQSHSHLGYCDEQCTFYTHGVIII